MLSWTLFSFKDHSFHNLQQHIRGIPNFYRWQTTLKYSYFLKSHLQKVSTNAICFKIPIDYIGVTWFLLKFSFIWLCGNSIRGLVFTDSLLYLTRLYVLSWIFFLSWIIERETFSESIGHINLSQSQKNCGLKIKKKTSLPFSDR